MQISYQGILKQHKSRPCKESKNCMVFYFLTGSSIIINKLMLYIKIFKFYFYIVVNILFYFGIESSSPFYGKKILFYWCINLKKICTILNELKRILKK